MNRRATHSIVIVAYGRVQRLLALQHTKEKKNRENEPETTKDHILSRMISRETLPPVRGHFFITSKNRANNWEPSVQAVYLWVTFPLSAIIFLASFIKSIFFLCVFNEGFPILG